MDDLTEQLRAFGHATEDAIPPTPLPDAHRVARVTDLDQARAAARSTGRPKPRSRVLVATAACVVIAVGVLSAMFVKSQDPTATVEFAAATQTGDVTETDEAAEVEVAESGAVPGFDNGWERVRFCESTSTYDIDTGNTFYGAYQFTRPEFREAADRVGLDQYVHANPAQSPSYIQDAVANAIYLEEGDAPWPVCGRFIEGPMVTPVIPQWIGQQGTQAQLLLVFAVEGLEPQDRRELQDEIQRIVEASAAASAGASPPSPVVLIDPQAAYEEFLATSPLLAETVGVDDMPGRFEIRAPNTDEVLQQLTELEGVKAVLAPNASLRYDPPPALRLEIPALVLDTPVYGQPTIEALSKGPVVLGGDAVRPIVAGYGSVERSIFANLADVQPGDLIRLTELLPGIAGHAVETIRTYEVATQSTRPVDQIAALNTNGEPALRLVADVAGDATMRLVIHATPVSPDTGLYGVDDPE